MYAFSYQIWDRASPPPSCCTLCQALLASEQRLAVSQTVALPVVPRTRGILTLPWRAPPGGNSNRVMSGNSLADTQAFYSMDSSQPSSLADISGNDIYTGFGLANVSNRTVLTGSNRFGLLALFALFINTSGHDYIVDNTDEGHWYLVDYFSPDTACCCKVLIHKLIRTVLISCFRICKSLFCVPHKNTELLFVSL